MSGELWYGRLGLGLGVGLGVAYRGLRSGKLSESGFVAAASVGVASLCCLPRAGLAMMAFYLAGSRATRVGAEKKELMEEGYKPEGGRRAEQVLACSAIATGLAIAHAALIGWDDRLIFKYAATTDGGRLHASLLLGIAAHYSTCAADTLSSELGILSTSQPRLITTLQPVPPGTNGGISVRGIGASILGGGLVGSVLFFSGLALNTNQRCPVDDISLIPICCGFGLAGSLLDSLLGATLQQTLFDPESKRVVHSLESHPNAKRLGGRALLNNQQVNLLSVALMTAVGCLYGYYSV